MERRHHKHFFDSTAVRQRDRTEPGAGMTRTERLGVTRLCVNGSVASFSPYSRPWREFAASSEGTVDGRSAGAPASKCFVWEPK